MEYIIVSGRTIHKLKEEVNLKIKQNWRPQGGVSSYTNYHGTMHCQAMIMGKDNGCDQ